MRTHLRLQARWSMLAAGVVIAGLAQGAEPPLATAGGAKPAPDGAQSPRGEDDEPGLVLERVVITATAVPLSQIKSSVSVSSMGLTRIQQSVPGSAADILRNIPGVHAEASGGEGNANISVRGLPSLGGSKFVQFQEDGLPVLDFGDIEFATADTFLRLDNSVDRLEVIRGGSASTFASHSPGGILNFISKTGEVQGGSVGITRGLGFDMSRVDFDYGQPLDPRLRFHIGGFYRYGEGARTVGYVAERGGQIKANLTREFDHGYVRMNLKLLDDRAPVLLPVPASISGTGSDPQVSSLPNFSLLDGAMQSKYLLSDLSVNADGQTVRTDIADGYRSKSLALGGEASFRLADGWAFDGRFRMARTSGGFVGPYPAELTTATAMAESIGGAGATLRYATGPMAGTPVGDAGALGGNGLAVRTHLFNTTLNNLGNFSSDFKLSRVFSHGPGRSTTLTLGYFKSRQTVNMDWHWNTYLQEVRGSDSALLDVVDADGNVVTQRGLVAYGEPFWGNCCVRQYRLRYDSDAPYAALNWQSGALSLDGSLRHDSFRANGHYASASGTRPLDVDGNGVIDAPERSVPVVDQGTSKPVNYTKRYLSYSLGANYLLNPDLAVFARVSEGGRGNATRLLFGGGVNPDGSVADGVAINKVRQIESGVKWRGRGFSVFATAFHATTEDTNQDITSGGPDSGKQRFFSTVYVANGLEIEASRRVGKFEVNGGLTYTRARVSKDEITPAAVGKVPARQARLAYQITPAYEDEAFRLALNVIGTTRSYAGPLNGLVMPGYTQVNAVASYRLAQGLWLSLMGNNLFNAVGVTEVQLSQNAVTADGLNTARSINGRTVKASLQYAF